LLAQRKAEVFKVIRARREREPAILRYKRILQDLPNTRSIEEEDFWSTGDTQEDYGEAAHYFLSVIRKASRRLDRWDWEKANGPTKDRKKEREERQKAYQNGAAIGHTSSSRAGQLSRSAAPRPPRPSKRKTVAPSTPSNVSKLGAAVSSKDGDTGVSQQPMSDAVDDTPIKTDPQPPSSSSLAGIIPAGRGLDADLDGDETLDDVDKDGLHEGSGHEDEDDSELSYAEDEHDDEGEGDEDELEEGEADVDGYGDYSTFEGRNGYDSYSEAGEDDVDGDEAMEE
jgi:Ino eighty subunit 1